MKNIREVMFNQIELSSLAKSGSFYWGLITPQLFLCLFIAMYFCTQSITKLVAAMSVEEVEQSVEAGIALQVEPVSVAELKETQRLMSYLEPDVTIKINEGSSPPQIVIGITKAESYSQFREALITVQSTQANAIWSANEICIGKCDGGAATATLTAKTQTVKMKSAQ